MDAIGKKHGWSVITWTKSGCAFADADITVDGARYDSCSEWNDRVLQELTADPPDLVITSQGRADAMDEGAGGEAAMVAGLERRWTALAAAGSKVAVLQDNQHPGIRVYECVADHRDELSRCAFDRQEHPTARVLQMAAPRVPGVNMIDLRDAICPTPSCPPVIGNVLVYRQGSHLTATYVKTLTPRLDRLLADVI